MIVFLLSPKTLRFKCVLWN